MFYLAFLLRDYFLDLDELFLLNEFYKYFDLNNDGVITFDEMNIILKQDNYNEDDIMSYIMLIKTILDTKFRLDTIKAHQYESIDYTYFIIANIIVSL